jgi:hypothetical protein
MTDQSSPITPPPELVQQWLCSDDYPWGPLEQTSITITANRLQNIATAAAQWGADQELEACCEWLPSDLTIDGQDLRSVRRPKPPSLKEQALEALQFVDEKLDLPLHNHCNAIHTIRRALEALPND